jgi:hypothetical protein
MTIGELRMKITQECLWAAIGQILPKMGEARKVGGSFNLPSSLNSAAIELFIIENEPSFRTNYESLCAAYWIRLALVELRDKGFMSFGSQDKFSL